MRLTARVIITMMTRRAIFVALAVIAPVLAGGCGPRDPAGPASSASRAQQAPDPQALRPVSLPELSQERDWVRDQVRERHASVEQKNRSTTPPAELATAYGELGLILMMARYHDAAASCFLNAQTLAPEDVRWPYYRGHLHLVRGERAEAAVFFERAVALRPADVAALIWLGEIYLDDNRSEAAESIFLQALSREPRSAAALFGAGRAALMQRAYSQAAEYLERALSIDAQASSVHHSLALAYQGLGDRAKAEAHLRQRGDSRPTFPDSLMQQYQALFQSGQFYENRGLRALREGQWAAAAAVFRKGLELEPANASLRHKLGTALYMGGDIGGAVEQFESAVQQSPRFAKAHFSLGVILDSNGRRQEAIQRFSAAVKYDPNLLEARLSLAEALRVSGELQASLPHYDHVIKNDPRIGPAWMGGAMALMGLGRYREAREWLTEGLYVHPDQPDLEKLLARLPADRE